MSVVSEVLSLQKLLRLLYQLSMKTKLTISISAPDLPGFREKVRAALAHKPGLIEIRTDALEDLTIQSVKELMCDLRAITKNETPFIYTCRDPKEGGLNDYPEALRVDVLLEALNYEAAFIDCEFCNFLKTEIREKLNIALLKKSRTRLILSAHNFEGPFDDIDKVYRRIKDLAPSAIPKIVYTANHILDTFECFDLLHKTTEDRIILCMGEAGAASRILAPKFDAFLTFASLDKNSETAPGQVTADELRNLYNFESIDAATEIYGIIASPVGHSKSPLIHNAYFNERNLNKVYVPVLLDGGYKEFVYFMEKCRTRPWLHFRGFSVSLPHKINAYEYVKNNLGRIDAVTEKIKAVNTLLISPDNMISAFNTDCSGAMEAIFENSDYSSENLSQAEAAVLGAGGVARAIVAGLKNYGAEVTIYNRTLEKAESLAEEFDCSAKPLNPYTMVKEKLIVNCTSLGMSPDTENSPLPSPSISSEQTIFDTVYNPPQTLLLKNAKSSGAKCIEGTEMFVNQAVKQAEMFSGTKTDRKLLKKLISDCLNSDQQL